MGRKTGSHAQSTRPLVRQTAMRLFAQFGYAAVSMRQIAAEVGVQAGALYSYTSDKQALLFDLMQEHMAELLAAWEAEPKAADPLLRLEAFVRFHIRHHIVRPDGVFVSYMELRNLSDEHFQRIETMRRQYEDILEDILRAGQQTKVFSIPDTRVTTMALIALLTGVNTWYRAEGRLSADALTQMYWTLARRAVGA